MRIYYLLAALIIACGAVYVFFGMVSFEPDPVRPMAIQEEPEINIAEQSEIQAYDPQTQAALQTAIENLKVTIESYNNEWARLPDQTYSLSQIVLPLVKQNRLPALYPNLSVTTSPFHLLVPINLRAESFMEMAEPLAGTDFNSYNCASARTIPSIFIGDSARNIIACNISSIGDQYRLFTTGPGDDVIETAGSPAIIDAGSGNDRIAAGPQQTILVFQDGFGRDTVAMDCSRAPSSLKPFDPNWPIPWRNNFTHFVVFGPLVPRDDIEVIGNVIRHKRTDDQIEFNNMCFNVVFASDDA